MMSTRDPYYGASELDRLRRMSLHHYDSRDYPYQRGYGQGDCASSPQDTDNEASGGSSRRRIAVACARCRKRKIKCSGDPGDGRGCENCRSANSGVCNFYRVGSTDLHHYLPKSQVYLASYSPEMASQQLDSYSSSPTRMYGGQYVRSQPLMSTRGASQADWAYGLEPEPPIDPYNQSSAMTYLPSYGQYAAAPWPTYAGRSNAVYSRGQTPSAGMQCQSSGMMPPVVPMIEPLNPYENGLVTPSFTPNMVPNRQLPMPSPALRSQVLGPAYYGSASATYGMPYGTSINGMSKRTALAGLPTPEDRSPKSMHDHADALGSAAVYNAASALTRYAPNHTDHDDGLSHHDSSGNLTYHFTQDTSLPAPIEHPTAVLAEPGPDEDVKVAALPGPVEYDSKRLSASFISK